MIRMIEITKNHYYILTGLLMFLSFPSYDLWMFKGFPFFAWIAYIPMFLFVKNKSYKKVFYISFITALLGNFLLYNWIGSFGANVAGGYYVVLAFLIPSLSVFFATKIIISEYLSRSFKKLRIIIYPVVWISIDAIQSVGHLAFPWTYHGYSQYPFTSFIQISSFTGVMGITFILIFTSCLFSDLIFIVFKYGKTSIKKLLQTVQFRILLILVLLLSINIIYGQYVLTHIEKYSNNNLRVALIQSCISPWENWKENRYRYLKDLVYYTKLSFLENPDMIIWSESATLEHISYDYFNDRLNHFDKTVLNIASINNKPLLTGEIGVVKDELNNIYYPQNNAVLINEYGEVVNSYSKIHLVPFGEWFPYEKWLPFIKALVVKFGGSDFVPGNGPVIFNIKDFKFGVLICYEGIFYRLCREYNKYDIDFLINITNDGWTNSYAGHMQHFAASKFRAIENGVWYVRVGNTGFTTIIDPYGRIKKNIPILKPGFIVDNINFKLNHETFYSKYGEIFLYITMIFLFGILLASSYKILYKWRIYRSIDVKK